MQLISVQYSEDQMLSLLSLMAALSTGKLQQSTMKIKYYLILFLMATLSTGIECTEHYRGYQILPHLIPDGYITYWYRG